MFIQVGHEIEKCSAVEDACIVMLVRLATAIEFHKAEDEATCDFVDAHISSHVLRSRSGCHTSHTVPQYGILPTEHGRPLIYGLKAFSIDHGRQVTRGNENVGNVTTGVGGHEVGMLIAIRRNI
jgi:hypothetical protein